MGTLNHPFDKLSWWLKLHQSSAGTWCKYIGRSVMWVGCGWRRHWSNQGCIENVRTAPSWVTWSYIPPLHTLPDPHNLGLPLFFDIPGVRYVVGALPPGVTYTIQTTAAKEYPNKVPSALKNSHLPISGLILEPRTFQVNGEEVKGRSTLTSYKKGQATPGGHPKRRGRPQL